MSRNVALAGLACFCLGSTGCQWFPDNPTDYPFSNCSGWQLIGCTICVIVSVILWVAAVLFIVVGPLGLAFDKNNSDAEKRRSAALGMVIILGIILLCIQVVPSPSYFSAVPNAEIVSNNLPAQITFKPPILPVSISINEKGEISVKGEAKFVTPIGVFAFGSSHALNTEQGFVDVVIRDRRHGVNGRETVYRVKTGENALSFVFVGETRIHIQDSRVTIDVSDGIARSINFEKSS